MVMKGTKEFYEVQDAFEKYIESQNCPVYFGAKPVRAPREASHFYENGKINDAFILFMAGYMNGRLVYMQGQ